MFPELQCLETRFGYLSLVGQSPSYGSASKALPRRDHAQFTVTVTAVVALMAPLEPATVTV